MKTVWDHSWYAPGDWSLPDWWTSPRLTQAEQVTFYNGPFARNVLNHAGGVTGLPATTVGRSYG